MSLQWMTYIAVGLSFALYIAIAIWAKASSTGEFYIAGKGVHPVANGMATAADWMSAASFISMAGLIAFLGYGASVYLMGWTGGYVLLAMFLAPYLRKYGKFTVPEFIGDRYYSTSARMVAVVCLIFISFTYVAGQMRGVGIVFSRFLETSVEWGLVIGMAIVFIYAVLGGMKGITYTQVAQYCVLIAAYIVPALFISFNLTGNPLPQLGLGSTVSDQSGYMLERLNSVVTELGFLEYTASAKEPIDMFAITVALMVGTAGLPHVIVRFFTVPRVRDARLSAGWALVFIALLYTVAPAVGAMARYNLTETVQIGEVGAPDGNLLYEDRPDWFKRWEATGLLEFTDLNGDGRIQYFNHKNAEFMEKAEKWGWKADPSLAKFSGELKVDRDIMVLANPEIAQLPDWVIALIAAGGIAAALSTAAGLLLVISSGISHDLLKGAIAKGISEKQELMAGRIAAAVAIGIAGWLGANPPGFVAQVVAFAFGLAASSLFPAIMMGIFSKSVTREGAIAGMLTGLVFTMGYILAYKGVFITPIFENTKEQWLFGISPEGIGAVGMVLNFIVAYVVSSLTPPVPAQVVSMVESIRTPRGAGEATHH